MRRKSSEILLLLLAAMVLALPSHGADEISPDQSRPAAVLIDLDVTPVSAAHDKPVKIKVSGLQAGRTITLHARTRDEAGNPWSSYAVFKADKKGTVDLAAQVPITGTYWEVDPMGLFWSMKPLVAGTSEYGRHTLEPVVVELYAEDATGMAAAKRILERLSLPAGVDAEPVGADGLVGMFFKPKSGGPFPGVILLNGPGGGLWLDQAAVLASHGYATFALGVFGIEGLPAQLRDIPLEYLEKGIRWMKQNEAVKKGGLAVMGRSRGGELALLLGSRFEDIRAVVAYAPSSVLTPGFPGGGENAAPPAAWTWKGRALPFLPYRITKEDRAWIETSRKEHRGVATAPYYSAGLEDKEAVAKAAIAVEKTRGPILLISGEKDGVWPATRFCRMIVERLGRCRFPYPYEHLAYEGAGHMIALPNLPTTVSVSLDRASGIFLEHGGRPEANAHAARDSWRKTLRFLAEHFAK